MRLSPHTWFVGAVLMMLAWWAGSVHLSLSAPMLDLKLVADDQPGLVVSEAPAGGETHLEPGTRLLRLGSSPLRPDLQIEEPDQLPGWNAYNEFMTRQERMARELGEGPVLAELDDSRLVEVSARARKVVDLPFMYWFQMIVGSMGYLIGSAVLAFRLRESAARHFFVAGLGMLIFTGAAAVYSSRELVMSGTLIHRLSILNHFGALLFTAALVALLWCYPRRLRAVPMVPAAYFLAAVFWSGVAFQWLPDMSWAHLVTLLLFSVSFVLAFFQWIATRRRPMERAALKWFLLSIYLGTGLFAAFILLPVALNIPPPASQGLVFMVFLFMFGGIALGILRFRLFDLDRWWFRAWTWFLGGVFLILADLALVHWLHITELGALALSLAFLGWIYFPLRQWAWSRFFRGSSGKLRARGGQWLQGLSVASDEVGLEHRWRTVLNEEFEPLETTEELPPETQKVTVSSDGQELRIPALGAERRLVLRYPSRGTRLFTEEDRSAARALLEMGRHVRAGLREREAVVLEERGRIMRDLHDDLGAKLLSLLHLSKGAGEDLARSAIQDMREVLAALEASPCALRDAAEEWQAEAQQRAETLGRELRWRGESLPNIELSPRQRTNLSRILREGITNACKHGGEGFLLVNIHMDHERLFLSITTPSKEGAPQWREGRGLRTIRQRAADLGGRVRWSSVDSELRMQVEIPRSEPRPQPVAAIEA